MLTALVLAAAATMPLGVWPADTGNAVVVVDDVEFYLDEPEDDYSVLAVQAVEPPLAKPDERAVRRLASVARKLGADAVLLLGELPVSQIPDDVETPLVPTRRYATAVYLVFDTGGEGNGDEMRRTRRPVPNRHRPVMRARVRTPARSSPR
jgi:hypothetical protein